MDKKLLSKLNDPANRPRFQWAGLAMLLTGAVLALYWIDPARPGIFPPCPFRLFTGLKCPGCGTLRGLHQLLRGHPLEAWRLNPLMVITLPLLAYIWLSYTWRVFKGRPLPDISLPAFGYWLLLVFMMVYWIGRNIVQ